MAQMCRKFNLKDGTLWLVCWSTQAFTFHFHSDVVFLSSDFISKLIPNCESLIASQVILEIKLKDRRCDWNSFSFHHSFSFSGAYTN